MPNRFERHIKIHADATQVFDYIADLSRHEEWATNPLKLTVDGDGPVEPGTTFRSQAKLMGDRSDVGHVTACQRPNRFEFETEGSAGTVHNWFVVREEADGCTLTKGSNNVRPSMFSRFMIPVLRIVVPRMYDKNLRSIKQHVEATVVPKVEGSHG